MASCVVDVTQLQGDSMLEFSTVPLPVLLMSRVASTTPTCTSFVIFDDDKSKITNNNTKVISCNTKDEENILANIILVINNFVTKFLVTNRQNINS